MFSAMQFGDFITLDDANSGERQGSSSDSYRERLEGQLVLDPWELSGQEACPQDEHIMIMI